MTTKISQIHDALTALCATLFTNSKKLTNPYSSLDNNELFLQNGFGVAVGAGSRTDRFLSGQTSWQRDFSVVLTALVPTTDQNIGQKEVVAKALLENQWLLLNALDSETTLGGLCIKAEVFSDSGIQFLQGQTGRYYILEIDVITEYRENLTA